VTQAASSSCGTLVATGLMSVAEPTRSRAEVPWRRFWAARTIGVDDPGMVALKRMI
jgi:hypothetical protein